MLEGPRIPAAPVRSARVLLGVVLFQFAPWFVFRPTGLDLIAACAERLPGDRIAVELRNKSWFAQQHLPETIAFEREHRLVRVLMGSPSGFPSSVPAVWEATCPAWPLSACTGATVQPGQRSESPQRNASTTFTRTRSYSEISGHARELGAQVGELHVLFNDCYRDNAQRNALALQALMNP